MGYIETINDCDRECPYCGDKYQVEAENYSEDEREETCDACGKKYFASDLFSVEHRARPDCELNGMAHDWVTSTRNPNFQYCSLCEACQRNPGIEALEQ